VDASPRPDRPDLVVIPVPEIRDYHAINAEIVAHLDAGRREIRLSGARGQRLLAAGLSGSWEAVIEVDGDAGPELAAGLDAPGLTVIGRGRAGDGVASGMRAGRVLVLGAVGVAFGYAQRGGLAAAAGDAGARAGLLQSGGDIVLLAGAGRGAAERQSGGRLFLVDDPPVLHLGRGRRGGRVIRTSRDASAPVEPADRLALLEILDACRAWLSAPAGNTG
jgi:glutamate synthase domain-containing protein 3